jgi:hypothetical integral membrane protein (TIGR02206 family)
VTLAEEIMFETFGGSHLVVLAVTVALGLGLPMLVRRAKSASLTRTICWVLAGGLVANELVFYGVCFATQDPMEVVRTNLPVHLCGVGVFLTAWALLRRRQLVYELAYFWGLAGTLQGVLTPDIAGGFPSYEFFQFFITHCGIVVGVLFATVGLGMRPRPGSVLKVFALTAVYASLVAALNWLVGANYMFLCAPPEGDSPFFFLGWPWYVAFLALVGLVFYTALYLPFYLTDRQRRRHSPAEPRSD